MPKTKFYIYIMFFLFKCFSLKCGEEEIENCLECNTKDKINTCIRCENKYYLSYNKFFCIRCDDPLNGQKGCGGGCFFENYKVICNENECKEGFYNLNGVCRNCSNDLSGCKTCIYLNHNNQNDIKELNCTKCLNNTYELKNGKCIPCSMDYCKKCHYDNSGSKICDECLTNFYLSENHQQCLSCDSDIKWYNF